MTLRYSNQTGSFVRMPKIRLPIGAAGQGYMEMSPGPPRQRSREYLMVVIGTIGVKDEIDIKEVDRLLAEIGYVPEPPDDGQPPTTWRDPGAQEAHEGRSRNEDAQGTS